MKPGNLLIQGAKSGGKRKMRIRYSAHVECLDVCDFFMDCLCDEKTERKQKTWKKDYLPLNV